MNASPSLRRYGLLALATALLCFANGRWILPLATWLAPVLLLRFLELAPGRRPMLAALALYVGAFLFAWQRMVPAPLPLYVLIVAGYAMIYFVPYALHRGMATRLNGITATLVFPTAWVAVEYLAQTLLSPYGSWFSLAYTQASNQPFIQLAAITGTYGVSFVIAWIASVAALLVGARRSDRGVRVAGAIAVIVFAAVLTGGSIRLAAHGATGEPTRVAALVPNPELERALTREVSRFRRSGRTVPEDEASLVQAIESVSADLIQRTQREAAAGAAIIAWSETAARILASQETDFVRALSELAATAKIHLFAGYGAYTHGAPKPLANRFVAIAPDGEVLWTFDKAHPIVGGESLMLAPGDAELRIAKTPTASVTAAICHDFDFPPLIRQASKKGATLLLAPSADWPEITAMHANMALLRAVENGIPLVRPTSGGRTLISDAAGVVISRQDTPRDAVVAIVTPGRSTTVYALFGDWFAYCCMAAFVALAVCAWRRASAEQGVTLLTTRMPAVRAAIVLVATCLVAVNSGAQEKSPLARADAALENCIAAAKTNDESTTISAADQAERLYADAERTGAPKADVLTGRARVLSQCRVRYASFLQQPGMVKRSIALLQQAIAADPNHTLAHYTLALNYYHAPKMFGQTDDALRELELIVQRWGTRRDLAIVGDAYFFLGRVYERLGRTKDAEAAWKKGAELFPANARLKRAASASAT